MTENLSRATAVELASMIASRAVSPVEVLDAHLATIARVNPKLNAIVTLVADAARTLAKAAETAVMRGDTLGALHGLPVAIKDITPTAGIRTTYGSPAVQGPCANRRCRSGAAAESSRRHRHRQDQHARICRRRQYLQRRVRCHAKSVESGVEPRGLLRWFGGCGSHRHGAVG